ncbi:MAG: acetylxylan esterase, partial [Planctomycetes bacterium]|nr:acetylxylan esterase [Planctomycetota bacterium]
MRLAATAALAWALAACAGAPAPEPGPEATRQPELPPLGARSVEHWLQVRRPELLGLFEQHVYGRAPTDLGAPEFEVLATDSDALAGLATRLVVHIALPTVPAWPGMDVLLYVPNDAEWPVPCFVGLNFGGNHTVTPEAGVPLPRGVLAADEHGEARRGAAAGRWPLEAILRRGFAVATAWYGDIEPDRPGGWQKGLRGAASPAGAATVWRNGDWGAIGAWAFGLSRIADYLEREVLVDADRLAVLGHSRL